LVDLIGCFKSVQISAVICPYCRALSKGTQFYLYPSILHSAKGEFTIKKSVNARRSTINIFDSDDTAINTPLRFSWRPVWVLADYERNLKHIGIRGWIFVFCAVAELFGTYYTLGLQ
jgi:hypothetical protein